MLHAKTAMIDGVWSCIGSTNLDWRSFLDNDEVNAVVLGRDFAGQMTAMIASDLEASEAITLEKWEQRSLLLRIKEWGARLLRTALERRSPCGNGFRTSRSIGAQTPPAGV